MHEEHKTEIKDLKNTIKHYKDVLKNKPFRYFFDKENTHDIARRIIKRSKKEIKNIESSYEVRI
jgi:uncharacterized protein YlaI